jgi:hypothetical protein
LVKDLRESVLAISSFLKRISNLGFDTKCFWKVLGVCEFELNSLKNWTLQLWLLHILKIQ